MAESARKSESRIPIGDGNVQNVLCNMQHSLKKWILRLKIIEKFVQACVLFVFMSVTMRCVSSHLL